MFGVCICTLLQIKMESLLITQESQLCDHLGRKNSLYKNRMWTSHVIKWVNIPERLRLGHKLINPVVLFCNIVRVTLLILKAPSLAKEVKSTE